MWILTEISTWIVLLWFVFFGRGAAERNAGVRSVAMIQFSGLSAHTRVVAFKSKVYSLPKAL